MHEQVKEEQVRGQAGAGVWNGTADIAVDENGGGACSVLGCPQPGPHRVNGRRACSGCLELVLGAAFLEEQHSFADAIDRMPHELLGQILLAMGAVTGAQLAEALERQGATGAGRLGCWLKQAGHVSDEKLTAALAVQGRCPVLHGYAVLPSGNCLPRLLMERFHVVPVLFAGQFTLAFERTPDAGLRGAIERMHGAPIAAGVLSAMDFWRATRDTLGLRAPRVAQVHAGSLNAWARAAAWLLADRGPLAAKLVVVRGFCWLRFTSADGPAHDLFCTVAMDAHAQGEPDPRQFEQLMRGMAGVLPAAA